MTFEKNFFAVILIGGMGSRFSKINELPKQMIRLNKRSLLENLIISFIKNGINNFVLPLGYKQNFFKKFFNNKKKIYNKKIKIYTDKDKLDNFDKSFVNIVLFDAGKKSSKLSRIKKSLKFFNSEIFLVTYGDGIADIKLKKYIKINEQNKKAIVACKYVNSQYGHLRIRNNRIIEFKEKPTMKEPINIGYYLFSKKIFNKFYNNKFELEKQFIQKLIDHNKIISYIHKGFFFNIDKKIDLYRIKEKYKKIIYKL
jgi:glucose-1-phosphate cytidylyltransferase